jgi:proline dehydrogenase
VIKELNGHGIGGILDLLGEGVEDRSGADAAFAEYLDSIKRISETGIDTTVSVKLTQLGLAFDKGACIDRLRRLAAEAQAIGATVEIDMEQSEYVVDTVDVYRGLQADFPDLRLAMQAYLRRTAVDLETMAAIKPKVRLVKGAYAEPEAVAFQKRREIDAQYKFLTDWLFEKGADPGIATHDHRLIDHAKAAAQRCGIGKTGFEIQMLYGIRRDLQQRLSDDGYRVRVYVPFGSAWYPYLMRRMAERPANLYFFLRATAGR